MIAGYVPKIGDVILDKPAHIWYVLLNLADTGSNPVSSTTFLGGLV